MENNELVTKSELKEIQLRAKLEDTVEILTTNLKQCVSEKAEMEDKLDIAKLQFTKQKTVIDNLTETNTDLEKQIVDLKAKLETQTEAKSTLVINNHAPVQETEPKVSEKITELEQQLSEAKKVVPAPSEEELIKKGLDSNNRIKEAVLKFILKTDSLPVSFVVGNLTMKRVFLNKNYYEVIE
ncbi:MAG TPA: hypothetical protein VN026_08490 [Bacteroidia bacterium]|jgi:hypothetical protein|nr:hypothetical protein [Bacteroidia bacterium]